MDSVMKGLMGQCRKRNFGLEQSLEYRVGSGAKPLKLKVFCLFSYKIGAKSEVRAATTSPYILLVNVGEAAARSAGACGPPVAVRLFGPEVNWKK